jgi:Asp-tRNA(Asn)/Glu-tRNA(Gln) amidotransferase A subunit family amidase
MALCRKVLQLSVLMVLISALIFCEKHDSKPTQKIDPLLFKSATELTGLIRRGEITSLKLLNLYIEHIQRYKEPLIYRRLVVNGKKRSYTHNTTWTAMAIVSGLPATVAPVGLSDSGLPVGVQIIGARFEDRTTIAFAQGLSELVGGFVAPPGYKD